MQARLGAPGASSSWTHGPETGPPEVRWGGWGETPPGCSLPHSGLLALEPHTLTSLTRPQGTRPTWKTALSRFAKRGRTTVRGWTADGAADPRPPSHRCRGAPGSCLALLCFYIWTRRKRHFTALPKRLPTLAITRGKRFGGCGLGQGPLELGPDQPCGGGRDAGPGPVPGPPPRVHGGVASAPRSVGWVLPSPPVPWAVPAVLWALSGHLLLCQVVPPAVGCRPARGTTTTLLRVTGPAAEAPGRDGLSGKGPAILTEASHSGPGKTSGRRLCQRPPWPLASS